MTIPGFAAQWSVNQPIEPYHGKQGRNPITEPISEGVYVPMMRSEEDCARNPSLPGCFPTGRAGGPAGTGGGGGSGFNPSGTTGGICTTALAACFVLCATTTGWYVPVCV